MWRWFSAMLVTSVAGANLEASQQDRILKLLTADSAHGASSTTASSQGNASKTSKAKAKTTQMEEMVLLLAQQAKAAREASKNKDEDKEMEEMIEQLRQELKMMQTEINEAANTSNAACQAAYDNLTVGCPFYENDTLFLPEGFDGNFTPLREDHLSCRETLPQKKQDFESCHKIRASLAAQEQVLLDSFRSVNVFQSPDECLVTGTDVLAYLKAMRDHFGNKKIAWWADYYKLENVTKNITQWNCTETEVSYYDQMTACENKQEKLEQIACEVHERTNESCTTMPACFEGKWSTYLTEVRSANSTIQDLKYEYRAIKRILCLLEAFVADDLDAKIEECMAARFSASAVHSQCVDNHANVPKPAYTVPGICDTGVTAILHPDHENFNETEYASKGIHASRCLASCCTVDWYSWTLYGNVYVPASHIMIDQDLAEGQNKASYGSVEAAKAACEALASVQCFGIYDANCDGASEESPVELVASPGLDLDQVNESSVGSCIYHMVLGSGTTTTTTIAEQCTWQLNISRSDEGFEKVWKTLTLEHQRFDEAFRFSGCDNAELPEASYCLGMGTENGVRVLKSREGHGVGTGSCCDSTTNKVIGEKRISCDGYLDEYTKHSKKYLTTTKLLRGTTYTTMAEAREACLRKGTKCWGIYDDKCDSVKFLLVDSQFNITSEKMMESVQGSCVYEKMAV